MDDLQSTGPIATIAEALANFFVVMIVVSVIAIFFGFLSCARSHHTIGSQICIFQKFDCKRNDGN